MSKKSIDRRYNAACSALWKPGRDAAKSRPRRYRRWQSAFRELIADVRIRAESRAK